MKPSIQFAAIVTITLAASGAIGNSGWAQSDQDHSAHHPADAPMQAMPSKPAPGMASPKGGMPGMMGGDMMPMMRMMQERMARQEMTGQMGMMPVDHVEGRLAFLRAELAITDAQQAPWNAFADALRAQAGAAGKMREQMMQGGMPQTWPDRMAMEQRVLSARLDGMKAIEGPARALYAALSPDQRTKADELMSHSMGGV